MERNTADTIIVTCDLSTRQWLTIKQATAYTTFCDKTQRAARDMNKLAFTQMGSKIIYKRSDLDLWVNSLEYHYNGRIKNKRNNNNIKKNN